MMYEHPQPLVRFDSSRKNKMMMERRRSASMRERAVAERLEAVDLSGRNLASLVPSPSSLNLGIIYKLDLSNNNLQMIPESLMARMLNLVELDVHSNQLRSLPNSIGCLSKLKVLNVAGNYLDLLPKTIENCKSLQELNANFNQLIKLPDAIGFELVHLRKLIVGSNKLVHLPPSTGHLTSLRLLDARLNCLRSLPEDLENLTGLQVLNVSQNFHHLKTLPYAVGLLLSLVELDVSYNSITTLPDSMGCLGKLRTLRVEGNPLVSPPIEVVRRGLDDVKMYLSEKMNNNHISPQDKKKKKKKKTWTGKLVKYGTFNSRCTSFGKLEENDGSMRPETSYRSMSYSSSTSFTVFSPWRLFSPKHHSAK